MSQATQLLLSVLPLVVWSQVRPPNLSPDNLPDTSFTCEDKVTGGYYADVEADCQLFHVCVQVSEYEFQDFHFLCPNDTVFDQQHLVCTNWFEVDCHAQLAFFTNDFGIKRGDSSHSFEDEDVKQHREQEPEQNSLGFNQAPRQRSRLRNTGRGQLEVGRRNPGHNQQHQRRVPPRDPLPPRQDAEVSESSELQSGSPEDSISLLASITGSTPIPLGFTTTIRPPRAIDSNPGGFLSGRNLVINHQEREQQQQREKIEEQEVEEEKEFKGSFPKFGVDGRRPKVKANIRAKLANASGKKRFFQKFDKTLKKSGRKVALDHSRKNKIEFVEPQSIVDAEEDLDEVDVEFTGPELRPDGRAARVKSDLFFDQQQANRQHETTTQEPFIEPFFASPSSPQPFIFRGTPDPFSEGDLFGSASTVAPFVPTVKSPSISSISQSPFSITPSIAPPKSDILPPSFQDKSAQADRFVSRPAPASRGHRHRVRIETDHKADEDQDISTQLSSLQQDQDDDDQRQSAVLDKARAKKLRLRQKNKIAAFNNAINDIDGGDKKCSNPFACQTKFLTAGRRPRVKSNLRARKRNFWQKTKLGGVGGDGNIVGKGFRRGRKIRRGRKQRPDVVVEKEAKSVDKIPENNKATEAFFPTTRTTTTTAIPRKETTTATTVQAVKEEENEIFDDFFDSGNDFFAASSTVSPVVFKGSPGPGFFSSPRPFSDGQVFFGTSPSPFGPAPGGPGGRPSFDNIGAHIDLGPPQVASLPDQLLHISSTVSNKIVIDSEDVSTTTPSAPVTTTQTPKRAFPSFPIRAGDNLNFKQKLDFSRKTKTAFKFGRQPVTDKVEEQDEVVTEANEETTEAVTITESSAETEATTKSRFFIDLTGGQKPRVKSNLKFNRKLPNKERFLKKLALLKAKKTLESTTLPSDDEAVTTPTAQTTPQLTQKPGKVQHKPFTFFGKVPDVGFTNTLLKFKSRNKALQEKLFASTESSLSVESELDGDEAIPDKVRKASKALADKNIRVEFKKKVDEDELSLGLKGKFLINPDGRKPRVKSNIRAKFANRGQHFPESEEETFDGASSQLDLTPFNKQLETAEDEVNREKKEVNIAEAPSAAVFNQIQEAPKLKVDLSPPPPLPPQQFSHELPLFPLQPVILNTRQSNRNPSQKPPLPPAILKHINHITDIRSLPPLPPLFRLPKPSPRSSPSSPAPQPSTTQSPNNSLLEKMLVTDNHSSSSPPAAPVSSPAASPSISVATPSISPSSASSKLSAFRALQQQVEKQEEPSQLSLV